MTRPEGWSYARRCGCAPPPPSWWSWRSPSGCRGAAGDSREPLPVGRMELVRAADQRRPLRRGGGPRLGLLGPDDALPPGRGRRRGTACGRPFGRLDDACPGHLRRTTTLARVLVHAVVAVGIGTAAAPTTTNGGHLTTAAAPIEPREPPGARPPTTVAPTVGDTPQLEAITQAAAPRAGRDHRAAGVAQSSTVEVAKGDTLWSIAERHLGPARTGGRSQPSTRVGSCPTGNGSRTRVDPTRLDAPCSRRSRHPKPSRIEQVTVTPSDTLWHVAEKAYGDGDDWPRIYQANHDQIDDPDLIYPGQMLERSRTAATHTQCPPPLLPASPRPGHDHDVTARRAPSAPQATSRPQHAARGRPAPTRGAPAPTKTARTKRRAATVDQATSLLRRKSPGRRRPTDAAVAPSPTVPRPALRARHRPHTARVGERRGDDPIQWIRRRSVRCVPGSRPETLASWCATSGVPLPDRRSRRLGTDSLDLIIPAPLQRPPPVARRQDGSRWTLSRDANVEARDAVAPYPTLVAIGVARRRCNVAGGSRGRRPRPPPG